MIHLRIVSPPARTEKVQAVLSCTPSVINVIELPAAARRPDGDVIMCDVAREDASVVISDVFVVFMVLAALLAAVGIFLDSEILIVGAMVVGPEFGPIAGFCVALVQRRGDLARRSGIALAVGFPLAITAAFLASLVFRATGLTPDEFDATEHAVANLISSPDAFTVIVALCAGAAGMVSLSTAKSGALIGVLISVTTIPAAANVGLAAAYGDWTAWRGSLTQLAINLVAILTAGALVLSVQRWLYRRRRREHIRTELAPGA